MRLLLIAFIAAWIGAQSASTPDRADAHLIQQLDKGDVTLQRALTQFASGWDPEVEARS